MNKPPERLKTAVRLWTDVTSSSRCSKGSFRRTRERRGTGSRRRSASSARGEDPNTPPYEFLRSHRPVISDQLVAPGSRPVGLTCVCPAQLLGVLVEGQTVGESQVVSHEDDPIGPVHVRHLDFRPVPVPVRPEQLPGPTGQDALRGRNSGAEKNAVF